MTDTARPDFRFYTSSRGVVHVAHPSKPLQTVYADYRYPGGRPLATAACGVTHFHPQESDGPATCKACRRYLARHAVPGQLPGSAGGAEQGVGPNE